MKTEQLKRYYQGLTSREEEDRLARHFAANPSDDEPMLSSLEMLRRADALQRRMAGKFARRRRVRRVRILSIISGAAAACVIVAVAVASRILAPADARTPLPEQMTVEEARIGAMRALAELDEAVGRGRQSLAMIENQLTVINQL